MKTICRKRHLTLNMSQLNELRHKTLCKAIARTKTFNDDKKNYYWYFLEQINYEIKKQGIKL